MLIPSVEHAPDATGGPVPERFRLGERARMAELRRGESGTPA